MELLLKKLILNANYLVEINGISASKQQANYVGIILKESPTQFETHGFKTPNGILLVTKSDLSTRIYSLTGNLLSDKYPLFFKYILHKNKDDRRIWQKVNNDEEFTHFKRKLINDGYNPQIDYSFQDF